MEKEEILKEYFGYSSLKKEQEKIINTVLSGKDCIGILPTGYGKSAAFQLPALILEGITLVVTPLISLMQDQVKHLKEKRIPAAMLSSLQTIEEQDRIYQCLGNIKLLYVSAERLQSLRFIREIKKYKISLFVCDEAHTLLWGEDFRTALKDIPDFVRTLPFRPRHLALTATATTEVVAKIIRYLNLYRPEIVRGDCDRKNIFYRVIHSSHKDRDLKKLLNQFSKESGLIYCLTVRKCEEVYRDLQENGFSVELYHGRMSSADKIRVQKQFSSKSVQFMVCTNAFGMGIDIPDIRLVVLYDLPQSIEDFVQQTGRASRDNGYAEAVVLFNLEDIAAVRYFIEHIPEGPDAFLLRKERTRRLAKMAEFCLTGQCLHQYICHYFQQPHKGNCGMCGSCQRRLRNLSFFNLLKG